MFGSLRLKGDGVDVHRFRTRRVALLLIYLALFRDRPHHREELGDILWPDADDTALRRNLRQALSSLRHVVEPPPTPFGAVLQVEQNRLRLNPNAFHTDVAEFERAIADGRRTQGEDLVQALKRAVAAYTGDLLPDFNEEWILQERFRLEDLYLSALRRLVASAQANSQHEDAALYFGLMLDKDPYSEELYASLMKAQLRLGRTNDAIRQYERFRALLETDLQQTPGTIVSALYEQARSESPLILRGTFVPLEEEGAKETGQGGGSGETREEERVAMDGTPFPLTPNPLSPREERGLLGPERVVRLPIQLTRFCGRDGEIERTLDQLGQRGAGIVTLVGPAGTGKTRLAIEVGRRLAETKQWNVWFVPLADLATGSMAIDAVLDAFHARRTGRTDPFDRLLEAIHEQTNNLLILDNAEHLVDDVAALAHQLSTRVGALQILVTTRQPLRITGEHLVALPPLPVPFKGAGSGPLTSEEVGEIARVPSVQLFVDRCQMVRPDFQLTVNNARAIASICGRLDGMPLAIELAAGLSGSFAPTQMVQHLQKRLTQLTSRRRDLPDRHRSLRAAIDYSFETLPPRLQEFFAALSVFRGGFTEAAAKAVFGEPEEDLATWLWELHERSLLRPETSDEWPEFRYRMLESFREYGDEALDEEKRRKLRNDHAAFYQTNSPNLSPNATAEDRTRRQLWIEAEFDNYIAAIDYRFHAKEFDACISLLGTLSTTWLHRGPRTIERSYIRRIADLADDQAIDPDARILLLRMLGTTLIRSADYSAAYEACHVALGVAECHGLTEQTIVCRLGMSTCAGYLGRLEECLELSQRALRELLADSYALRERALLGVGAVYWGQGRLEEADAAFRDAAKLSAKSRGGEADVLILGNLARVSLDLERYDEAMIQLGEVMRICRRLHDEFGLAVTLSLVGRYHRLRGQLAAALASGKEALLKFREMDFLHYSLVSIFQHALAVVDSGEWEAGATLLAATHGIGKPARLPDQQDHVKAVEKIRAHVSEASFERAWARGLAMGTEEAFRLALTFT